MSWFTSIVATLSDAADGFMIMYNEGYLNEWLTFVVVLLIGIALGWGMRSGIVYKEEEE